MYWGVADMVKVKDVFQYLKDLAPLELKIEGDNPGFLVGSEEQEVERVLVALDITPEVIDEGAEWGAGLIVSHHPVIYSRLSSVTDNDYTGVRVLKLAGLGMAAICMHTNLDIAEGGVNDALAERIGLQDISVIADTSLSPCGDRGVCRMGSAPNEMRIEEFAEHVARSLGGNGVKYLPGKSPVRKVAVGGGSCGGDLPLVARAGCDTFVTSEVKHGQILEAQWYGINLIDAGHFATEDVICPVLVRLLRERFKSLEVKKSERMGDPMRYIGV